MACKTKAEIDLEVDTIPGKNTDDPWNPRWNRSGQGLCENAHPQRPPWCGGADFPGTGAISQRTGRGLVAPELKGKPRAKTISEDRVVLPPLDKSTSHGKHKYFKRAPIWTEENASYFQFF